MWISIFVDDVDALDREDLANGANIRQPPATFQWGNREINIEDSDGHRLRIGHERAVVTLFSPSASRCNLELSSVRPVW